MLRRDWSSDVCSSDLSSVFPRGIFVVAGHLFLSLSPQVSPMYLSFASPLSLSPPFPPSPFSRSRPCFYSLFRLSLILTLLLLFSLLLLLLLSPPPPFPLTSSPLILLPTFFCSFSFPVPSPSFIPHLWCREILFPKRYVFIAEEQWQGHKIYLSHKL